MFFSCTHCVASPSRVSPTRFTSANEEGRGEGGGGRGEGGGGGWKDTIK